MELARKCGIETAKTKLVKDKDSNYGLLVTRFDRTWNPKEEKFLMHHQEDACQFLNKYPAEKYRISINDIVKGIEKHVPAAKVAILKLLQLYAFSYLIGNGDLHAKNVSLLIKSDSQFPELSPAYDLICTYIYGDHKMAIKLDGRDDNLKRKNFIDFGLRFGVPEVACNKMLDRLLFKLKDHSSLLNQVPITEKSRALLSGMLKKRFNDLS
jgi:serine/threonine-protein kinase HipA